MDALDKVRIRLQKLYGYNSKEYRLLKNKKNVTLLRKYSNDIDWWVYTKRYKNKHMVDILKFDLREQLLKIHPELNHAYTLKELFLDKVIKRIAYGYRNFEFFRLRLMYILNGKVIGISKKDRNTKNEKISVIIRKKRLINFYSKKNKGFPIFYLDFCKISSPLDYLEPKLLKKHLMY